MTKDELLKRVKTGDVFGFSGSHYSSDFINAVTLGIPRVSISHVGIVCEVNGEKLLFEAMMEPAEECIVSRKVFAGAQAHLASDVLNYQGKVWHYPLYRELFQHEERRLRWKLIATVGTPYDTIGAMRSGGLLFAMLEASARRQNKTSLFCSEWVATSLSDIGIFATGNVSRWNPNKLIRRLRLTGILEEPYRLK